MRFCVVDEESEPNPVVLQRFATLAEAEAWIAEMEKSNPEKVHRGGYGIDGPVNGEEG